MGNTMRIGLLVTALLGANVALAIVPDHRPAANRAAQQAAEKKWIGEYQRDLCEHLTANNQPRDWALAAPLHGTRCSDDHAALLRRAAQAAPDDALVQWLWASLGKPERSRIPDIEDRAANLRRIEPDNVAAWTFDLAHAVDAKDETAMDVTLAHMAAATRDDPHWSESTRAWYEAVTRFPPASPPSTALLAGKAPPDADYLAMTLAFSWSSAYALPAYQHLVRACTLADHPQAGAQRAQHCETTARLMLGKSSTCLGQRVGAAVLRKLDRLTADDQRVLRDIEWVMEQGHKLLPGGADSNTRQEAELMQDWKTRWLDADVGETEGNRRVLARHGIPLTPPVDWVSRWAAKDAARK